MDACKKVMKFQNNGIYFWTRCAVLNAHTNLQRISCDLFWVVAHVRFATLPSSATVTWTKKFQYNHNSRNLLGFTWYLACVLLYQIRVIIDVNSIFRNRKHFFHHRSRCWILNWILYMQLGTTQYIIYFWKFIEEMHSSILVWNLKNLFYYFFIFKHCNKYKIIYDLDVSKPKCAAVGILWESYRTIVFTTDKVSLALIAPITVTLIECTRRFTCTATSIIGLTITNFAWWTSTFACTRSLWMKKTNTF